MDKVLKSIAKLRRSIAYLPDKKKYIELVTASLSVPVLLSVVYINYLNIQERKVAKTPTPTEKAQIIVVKNDNSDSNVASPTPQISQIVSPSKEACSPKIGPIDILSPKEGETLSSNPLEINIKYLPQDIYCAVVWSYRLNSGTWSEYSDRNLVIFNLPSGQKKLELKVKSIVSGEEKILERNFIYKNTQEVTTPTQTITTVPTQQPTQ